jgi:hypothetical protein
MLRRMLLGFRWRNPFVWFLHFCYSSQNPQIASYFRQKPGHCGVPNCPYDC